MMNNLNVLVILLLTFTMNLRGAERVSTNTLEPPKYLYINVGDIEPQNWLKQQLSIQADGFSGYVDEYWSDIESSQWSGGWAEGWERFPYFLDGLVPLSVISKNQVLLEKTHKYVEMLLANQTTDGWFGPVTGRGNLGKGQKLSWDPWPSYVILKALIQWHQYTNDDKVLLAAMVLNVKKIDSVFDEHGMDQYVWAKYRLMDFLLVCEYLFDVTKDDAVYSIIEKYVTGGFDWFAHFKDFQFKTKIHGRPKDSLAVHGVNNAQAMKWPAIRYRFDKHTERKDDLVHWIEMLQTYHSTATGLFHGDELYGGLSPTQGSELCLIVEYLFSLGVSQHVFGDTWIGDLLEKVAYNNLPSALDKTMNVHQYVAMDNQVACIRPESTQTNFTDVGYYGNLYGQSPNYGCCTANYHQGWPKFVTSSWGKTDDALVSLVFAPTIITTKLVDATTTTTVQVELETDYPFGDGKVSFNVLSTSTSKNYSICFRVPNWIDVRSFRIYVNRGDIGEAIRGEMKCVKRAWAQGDSLQFQIPMNVHLAKYSYHNSVSLFRGPLHLALPISYTTHLVHRCPLPIDKHECEDYYDYELVPSGRNTEWNYGLIVDRQKPSESVTIEVKGIGEYPFGGDTPAVVAKVKAQKIDWKFNEYYMIAEEVPYSPVEQNEEEEETLELHPFGNTNLRVGVFPTIKEQHEN